MQGATGLALPLRALVPTLDLDETEVMSDLRFVPPDVGVNDACMPVKWASARACSRRR